MSRKSIRQPYKNTGSLSRQVPIKMNLLHMVFHSLLQELGYSPECTSTKGEVFLFCLFSTTPLTPNLSSFSALCLTVQKKKNQKGQTSMSEWAAHARLPLTFVFLSFILLARWSRSWPQQGCTCSCQGSEGPVSAINKPRIWAVYRTNYDAVFFVDL